MLNPDTPSSTVRQLRLALGLSQAAFGQRLGKSLPTITRWETLVSPRGRALVELEALAHENGFDEIAAIFVQAFSDEMGRDFAPAPPRDLPAPRLRAAPLDFRSDEEVANVTALLAAMRNPKYATQLRRLEKILKRSCQNGKSDRQCAAL